MPSTGLSINSTRWRKSQGIWRSQEITQTKAYKHKKREKLNTQCKNLGTNQIIQQTGNWSVRKRKERTE